jgi:NTP pyrophosphatase (non-canonical NTP hydrolase)
MNYTEYQKLARRTESLPKFIDERTEWEFRLNHANIGLQTEIGELFESEDDEINMKEELGDIFWYLDLACHVFGITIYDLPTVRLDTKYSDEIRLIVYNAQFADKAKCLIYYRQQFDLDNSDNKKAFKSDENIKDCLNIADDNTIPVHEILESNIAKLSARFPDKYTDQAALNRDIEKERQVLEG